MHFSHKDSIYSVSGRMSSESNLKFKIFLVLCRWTPPSSLDIAGYLPSGSGVTHEDIIMPTLKIDLTAGNSNPLEKVSFFDHYGSDKKRGLRESDMTALMLQYYEVSLTFSSTCRGIVEGARV